MFGCRGRRLEQQKIDKEFQNAIERINNDPLMGLNKDSIKNQYGNKFFELRSLINNHDPIGLINMGCPEDEYEAEVKTIIVQLGNKQTENEILDLVYTEFERWFGDAGNKKNYLPLASDIFKWQNENPNK
jgi:hypothetical protein